MLLGTLVCSDVSHIAVLLASFFSSFSEDFKDSTVFTEIFFFLEEKGQVKATQL